MQIAMGSGSELSYHLLLANDLNLIAEDDHKWLSIHLDRVMKMLSALSGKLKGMRAA